MLQLPGSTVALVGSGSSWAKLSSVKLWLFSCVLKKHLQRPDSYLRQFHLQKAVTWKNLFDWFVLRVEGNGLKNSPGRKSQMEACTAWYYWEPTTCKPFLQDLSPLPLVLDIVFLASLIVLHWNAWRLGATLLNSLTPKFLWDWLLCLQEIL